MTLFLWALLIACTVVLDRVSKLLTVAYLKPIGDFPLIDGWLHLSYVENTGAAFGMLKDQRWLFIIVSTLGIGAIAALLLWARKRISVPGAIALCLIIGGGIGNQIDRIFDGYVVDMIYVKIIDFAVFNLADSFVCIGVGMMLICCFTVDKWLLADENKKENGALPAAEDTEHAHVAEESDRKEDSHE